MCNIFLHNGVVQFSECIRLRYRYSEILKFTPSPVGLWGAGRVQLWKIIYYRIFPFFIKEGVDDEHSESDGVVVFLFFMATGVALHNYLPLRR